MADTAPEAHTQYPPQRWHIEFRMHIDTDTPGRTYFTADISKKVGLGPGHTWLTQERYDWLPIEPACPPPGMSFHAFMIERLDEMRVWLVQDLKERHGHGYRDLIRPELGVSVPTIPYQAG